MAKNRRGPYREEQQPIETQGAAVDTGEEEEDMPMCRYRNPIFDRTWAGAPGDCGVWRCAAGQGGRNTWGMEGAGDADEENVQEKLAGLLVELSSAINGLTAVILELKQGMQR